MNSPPPETPVERRIRVCLEKGEPTSFADVAMDAEKTVSPVFLRDLIVRRLTDPRVAPVGIAITGAIIDGDLSCRGFASADNPLPGLDLSRCTIRGKLDLSDSYWTSIVLDGCSLEGLKAIRLKVDNGLRANDLEFHGDAPIFVNFGALFSGSDVEFANLGRTSPPCSLNLRRARITGGLIVSGAHLTKPDPEKNGEAFAMDGAEVTGTVYLEPSRTHRFEADGVVSLLGAKVGGGVQAGGACLKNNKGDTLSMDGAEVAGSVFLQPLDGHRFESEGAVSLLATKIGGMLNCVGAHLKAATAAGDALSMDCIEIKGGVFLRASDSTPFEADGPVRLQAAKIGGVLDCFGARFRNATGNALLMEGGEVASDLDLTSSTEHRFESSGLINLCGSRIGGSFHCSGRMTSSKVALDLSACRVSGKLTAKLEPESSGQVSLRGTHVTELDDDAGSGWGALPYRSADGKGVTGILLRLDGFTYERLGSWERPPPPTGLARLGWLIRRILGIGVEQNIWWNRTRWLDRQYVGDNPCHEDFFPQPHEHLTKILRLMGHNYDARRVASHKFFHESRCGADELIARLFMYPHRWLFGCGYLPTRALMTVVVWLLVGWVFTSWALVHNERNDVVFVKAATGVEMVRALADPDTVPRSPTPSPRDAKKEDAWIFAAHEKVDARDIPCTNISPFLYALDTMLPVVRLRMEERCEMADSAPWWRFGRAAYALIGWVIVGLAALTWTGVLQRDLK
jgi:hypothetical protein